MIRVIQHINIESYLQQTETFFLKNESRNTMPLAILDGIRRGTRIPKENPIFLSIEENGEVTGAAVRTPPYGLTVTMMPDSALAALLSWCQNHQAQLSGVVGPLEISELFCTRWCERMHKTPELFVRLGEYELREVTPGFPRRGTWRRATEADLNLVAQWTVDFAVEAVPHEKANFEEFRQRALPNIHAGRVFLLEDQGQIVSKTGLGGDTPNGTRLSQVYTPPEFRKQGYAGTLVAEVSQIILDSGKSFANLFTDLSNPTSNSLYQRIGYRYLGESRHYGFG